VSIGASFSARGGESVMYASVASKAATATKGAELFPIAGAITFVMSVLCPLFIKRSYDIADWFAVKLPAHISYGGAVFSRTLGKMILPGGFRLFRMRRRMLAALTLYLVSILAILSMTGDLRLVAFLVSLGVCTASWFAIRPEIREVVRRIDFSNLGTIPGKADTLSHYVATVISLSMVMCVVDAYVMVVFWPSIFIISAAYVGWLIYLMKMVHHHTCDDTRRMPDLRKQVSGEAKPAGNPAFGHRERWKAFENDDQD
jgi:hypothetical protein